jgi:hypothetical protein
LPVDLRRRSYEATATQNGADVTVTLTEPRFKLDGAPRGNFFRGRAESGRVVFSLTSFYNYYYYYYGPVYPDIVEQLPDGTYLVPAGSAIVTGSPDRVSGDLDGVVSNYDSRFPNRGTNVLSSCEGRYRFTLTRR